MIIYVLFTNRCIVLCLVLQLVPLSVVAAQRYVVMFRDAVYLYAVPEAHCDTLYRFKGRKGRHFLLRLKDTDGPSSAISCTNGVQQVRLPRLSLVS